MKQLENNWFVLLLITVGAFALYGNTLSHQYALDDAIVITKNQFTTQGVKGIKDIFTTESFTGFFGRNKELVSGGRYRPLSIASFALEYQMFGENPFVSHLINIILYALIVFGLYRMVQMLFYKQEDTKRLTVFALLSSFIFLIHPIHTECVANIKGRDELFSLLFSLLAFIQVIKFVNVAKVWHLTLAAFLLFFALLSKENSVAFVLIIPVGVYLFKLADLQKSLFTFMGLLGVALLFLVIRNSVLGGMNFQPSPELMNNPFVHVSGIEKYATIFYTWLIYFKLLVFPHPLTYDYYPYHVPIVQWGNPFVIVSIALVLFLVGAMMVNFRKKTIISFAIFGFAATFVLVSNLFFSVGTFMNERFVFMPSLFWALALGWFFSQVLGTVGWKKYLAYTVMFYMVSFYPIKTIARNMAWENDFTLFTTDVKTSFNSAKSTCSAGGKLWEKAKPLQKGTKQANYYKQAEEYLRQSLKIYPKYVDAWLLLGNVLFDAHKDIKGSATCYLNVIKLQPENVNGWNNIDVVLQNSNDNKLQLAFYQQINQLNPQKYMPNYRLGVLYGRYFNNLEKSIHFLQKAIEIDNTKVETLKDLGTAYGIAHQPQKAYAILQKALELDENDKQIYVNLGLACQQLGKPNEAAKYFAKAKELDSQ